MTDAEMTERILHAKVQVSDLAKQLEHGCGNHGCIIKKPEGQGMSASCRCYPHQIAIRLRDIAWSITHEPRVTIFTPARPK